jgi:hypothetical protein
MALFDGFHQVLGSIVDAGDDIRIPFGVGGPENNDLVEIVLGLEVAGAKVSAVTLHGVVVQRECHGSESGLPHVPSDLFNMSHACLLTR